MNCHVTELKSKLERNDEFLLLDVRTQGEYDIARIEGSTLLPLHELAGSLSRIKDWKDKEVVCMCHHGGRSAQAQAFLLQSGFSDVKNLVGGIDAYSLDVDPGVPRYD